MSCIPRLTVAIAAYNAEKWLPVALESCLWQSLPEVEAVVVDDGSTDGTARIAAHYAARDERVRLVRQENAGAAKARAAGLAHARGEYLIWLDADDFLDRHAARGMIATAGRDGVDMVCGNAVVFSELTFNARRYFHHPPASRLTFDEPRYWKSKVCWRWMFRTAFLREREMVHIPLVRGEDVCFMFSALCQVGRFSQSPHPFYYFRQDHKGMGSRVDIEVEHDIGHFVHAKHILLQAGRVKPLIKYLTENYFRNIKKMMPRIAAAGDHWVQRTADISLEIFEGLDPRWFTAEYLAPELSAEPEFVPLAEALIARDRERALAELRAWSERRAHAPEVDKKSPLHLARRRMKALLNPLSHMARRRLRELEARALKRLRTMADGPDAATRPTTTGGTG